MFLPFETCTQVLKNGFILAAEDDVLLSLFTVAFLLFVICVSISVLSWGCRLCRRSPLTDHSAPPSQACPANKSLSFRVGDLVVYSRDGHNFKPGFVTKIEPSLLVKGYRNYRAKEYKFVRRLRNLVVNSTDISNFDVTGKMDAEMTAKKMNKLVSDSFNGTLQKAWEVDIEGSFEEFFDTRWSNEATYPDREYFLSKNYVIHEDSPWTSIGDNAISKVLDMSTTLEGIDIPQKVKDWFGHLLDSRFVTGQTLTNIEKGVWTMLKSGHPIGGPPGFQKSLSVTQLWVIFQSRDYFSIHSYVNISFSGFVWSGANFTLSLDKLILQAITTVDENWIDHIKSL